MVSMTVCPEIVKVLSCNFVLALFQLGADLEEPAELADFLLTLVLQVLVSLWS